MHIHTTCKYYMPQGHQHRTHEMPDVDTYDLSGKCMMALSMKPTLFIPKYAHTVNGQDSIC
jgi:hypothetical protein